MAAREAWLAAQPDLDPAKLIFIDETGASTKMARVYGRAPRGERCRAAVPHGHWLTTTFTAGLRYDRVTATMLIEGPNPIEMAFSKFKSILRGAAARTVDDLWDTASRALRRFTASDCANYFAAAGYSAG